MQNYLHLLDGERLRVPAQEIVLLQMSLQCKWHLLFKLKKQLSRSIAKTFPSLFNLLLSCAVVGKVVIKM